jgi:hypothetical protein
VPLEVETASDLLLPEIEKLGGKFLDKIDGTSSSDHPDASDDGSALEKRRGILGTVLGDAFQATEPEIAELGGDLIDKGIKKVGFVLLCLRVRLSHVRRRCSAVRKQLVVLRARWT